MGPEVVQQYVDQVELIRKRLVAAQSRQKCYADRRHRLLEFEVGDFVFLKVSPTKGVTKSIKRGKLSPRYIGPYRISKRVGEVAYKLDLPLDLTVVVQIGQYLPSLMLRRLDARQPEEASGVVVATTHVDMHPNPITAGLVREQCDLINLEPEFVEAVDPLPDPIPLVRPDHRIDCELIP